MTVLSAMQSAAIRLVGYRPSVFFSSSEQFEQELVDLVNEAAKDIVQYQDWQSLISIANFTGDGVIQAFDKPDGYDRMMLTAEVQDLNNWVWGYDKVESVDQFMFLQARGFGPYPGIWSIFNDKFNFYPAPPAGQLAAFPYINKNYAVDTDGVAKPEFTQDDDTFKLTGGERLLTLWLVWRWRENKKMDSTGDQENFVKAIDELAAKDRGSKVMRSGSPRVQGRFHLAYPYTLGGV